MPIASPTDWITLDRVRNHLRVDSDYDADELNDILAAAVGWVEQWTGRPILDREFRIPVVSPGDTLDYSGINYFAAIAPVLPFGVVRLAREPNAPFRVPVRGVRGSLMIEYWQDTQTLSDAPSGTLMPGRVEEGRYVVPEGTVADNILVDYPLLYPPSAGWPDDALEGAPFVIKGAAGSAAAADVPSQWKIAALHICSALFESPEQAGKFTKTAKLLLAQWTDKGRV